MIEHHYEIRFVLSKPDFMKKYVNYKQIYWCHAEPEGALSGLGVFLSGLTRMASLERVLLSAVCH